MHAGCKARCMLGAWQDDRRGGERQRQAPRSRQPCGHRGNHNAGCTPPAPSPYPPPPSPSLLSCPQVRGAFSELEQHTLLLDEEAEEMQRELFALRRQVGGGRTRGGGGAR